MIQSSDITSWNLVNIGLGNGLLPDGTKPLAEPVLINHQWKRVTFTWGQFHRNDICLWYDFENNSFKITATMSLKKYCPERFRCYLRDRLLGKKAVTTKLAA